MPVLMLRMWGMVKGQVGGGWWLVREGIFTIREIWHQLKEFATFYCF
jgi:hypothetical protein